MANSASANKRIRQNETHRLRNKSVVSEIKTLTKKFVASVEKGEAEAARALYPVVISKMDRAGRRCIYHRNTVARKKSALTRLLNTLGS
ncbi:MAG: 30S ribosomal protein S20 [Planctomycetes bacterium]|nr:30S ribosomal protein S20 [Planctomycetota bacterium]